MTGFVCCYIETNCKGGGLESVLKFENVGKRFGHCAVLSDVDFTVHSGNSFGLAGLNGAGKTTLMKCMLDFCTVDSGKVEIFGLPSSQPRSRRRIAYLPERFQPPHYLKGSEFLNYSGRLYGSKHDLDAVRIMMEDLDLEYDALAKPVRSYSKGMIQKIGLAACFLSGKDLLVLDEPMSGLDPKARMRLKKKLIESREAGKTLFFTSHSLSDMEEICDRLVVLHRGSMKFSGEPRSLKTLHGESDIERAFLKCIGDG